MKRITAIALFALTSIVTMGTAAAQQHGVRANIPFDFTVNSILLPAGNYTITSDNFCTIVIRNDHRQVSVLRSSPAEARPSKDGKLTFNKYGNQYFLSEILSLSTGLSADFPVSKVEKRARLQEASLHQSDQVFVALNK